MSSGEARILISFHAADGVFYFGWVTYDDPVTFVLDEEGLPPPPPPPLELPRTVE